MDDRWECSLATHQTVSVPDACKSGTGTGAWIAIPSSHYAKLFPAEDEFKGPEKTDAKEGAGLKIETPRWLGTWSRVQVFRI